MLIIIGVNFWLTTASSGWPQLVQAGSGQFCLPLAELSQGYSEIPSYTIVSKAFFFLFSSLFYYV